MEETNVTMTTEEMQGEPAAKENETKAEKFIRIGEYRMNRAVGCHWQVGKSCEPRFLRVYTGTGRCYVSTTVAKIMKEENLCLEEYLEKYK